MKRPIFPILCAALACLSAAANDGDAPAAPLSETPATVLRNPTGTLSRGRPYQGTPSSVVSASGKRLFVAWYGDGIDENLDNYVMVAYDDGATADDPPPLRLVVRSPHVGKVRCCDPCLWRDPDGRVHLSWCQTGGETIFGKRDERGSRDLSEWEIHTDNPDDPEPVWSEPRRLFSGNMMNKPLYLKNGYILYCVCVPRRYGINDLRSRDEGLWIYRSKDGGKTLEKISGVFLNASATESMLVERADGVVWLWSRVDPITLYATYDRAARVFKKRNTPTDGIYEAFSHDGGVTFTQALPSKVPHVGSRFFVGRLASGNLLLVKNYANDERWLAGKPKAPYGEGDAGINANPKFRKRILVYLSRDEGKTWEGGLSLDDRQKVNYPDASQDADGFIYITWDHDRYNEPEILAAKITEADILAGKIITEGSAPARIVNKGPLGKTARSRARIVQ